MAGSYCIICGKEKKGIAVSDDHVLKALRWFKKNVTRNVRNNKLVVCKECYPQYTKMRKRYVGRRTAYVALGVLFLMFAVIVSAGASGIAAFIIGVIIIIFLYLLSLVNYMPALQLKKQKGGSG